MPKGLNKGYQLLYDGKYAEAYDFFTICMSVYDRSSFPHSRSAMGKIKTILALGSYERLPEAESLLHDLIRKHPTWNTPYLKFLEVITLYRRFNQNLFAENALKALMRHDPTWIAPYLRLAQLYEDLNRVKEADEVYLDALNKTNERDDVAHHYQSFLLRNYVSWQTQPIYIPQFSGLQLNNAALLSSRSEMNQQQPM